MKLTITRVDAAEAARYLEPRLPARLDTSGGIEVLPDMLAGCACFRVADEAGETVSCYALKVIERAAGDEVVIVAAAGGLKGADLTASVLPFVELQAGGAKLLTVHTRRAGLLAKLGAQGWNFGGYIMHKALSAHGHA